MKTDFFWMLNDKLHIRWVFQTEMSSSNSTGGARAGKDSPAGPKKGQKVPRKLNEQQQNEIREAFDLFDSDKDGFIDYHEFKVAMQALGFDKKKAEVQQLMQQYDKESSGKLLLKAWSL